MGQTIKFEDETPSEKKSCMGAAKKQAEQYKKFFGPSNSELLKEIQELRKELAEIKNLFVRPVETDDKGFKFMVDA